MKFKATLEATGGNTTGIQIPPETVEALHGGRRPAVKVNLNGFSYRTSIGSMGGRYMLPVSAERRRAAGVEAGDSVELELTLDGAAREPASTGEASAPAADPATDALEAIWRPY